ncbi:MAG TPA: DegT/DnrJ/EryC1/StrS family aminotransferase [Spirochaetia bacterium]|nr:DegT/DnrJ/EryC1/StrS family aminotransferase [Spirochaetia bacterium]
MREELALFGGPKTARDPFPPWPLFSQKTIADAVEPLRTGRVGYWSGPRGREFETRWAQWIGARRAVTCASGTAALHIALLSLGVGPGDEVIVPSHTFASTSLAVVHAGAVPVFCDVVEDGTIDPRGIEPLVTARTRGVVAVHLYGAVCAMDRIAEAAARHSLAVVEDCAQCVGGEFKGRKAGTLGRAGCFSFSQGKHVCSGGEGGMVVTDSDELADACASLRDYGREQDPAGSGDGAPAAHVRVGYNYRMTEIQAAVGLGELERVDTWNLPRRRGYARAYDHAFGQLYEVKSVPFTSTDRWNAYWKYPLQVDLSRLACNGEELRRALAAEGIPECGIQWPESYHEPALARWAGGSCPVAEALRARTVILGLAPSWEKTHIDLCIAAVKKVLRVYKR